MLTVVALCISVAGLTVLSRKISASILSVLHLSDELDPVRPPAATSEFRTPSGTNTSACGNADSDSESLLRLSNSIVGLSGACGESRPNVTLVTVPAAQETPD
jgi:hypothetical protein